MPKLMASTDDIHFAMSCAVAESECSRLTDAESPPLFERSRPIMVAMRDRKNTMNSSRWRWCESAGMAATFSFMCCIK